MKNKAESTPDLRHLWAKSGYELLLAARNLVSSFQTSEDQSLTNNDLIAYLAAYCRYSVNEYKTYSTLPDGLTLQMLENADLILHRMDAGIFGTQIIPARGRQIIKTSLLRGMNTMLRRLLTSRYYELERNINRMQMELQVESPVIQSTESVYFTELLEYHRELVIDEKPFTIDLNAEITAVQALLAMVGGIDENTES